MIDNPVSPLDIPRRLLIAIGGNAIHPAGIKGTSEEQFQHPHCSGWNLMPPGLVFFPEGCG